MCGRFALTLPHDAMANLFSADVSSLPDIPPQYNICPTQQVVTITSQIGMRNARLMRWGFVPSWYKMPAERPLLINARAETIDVKPAFREACRRRRCLIPATGFYEWSKNKDGGRNPWFIQPKESEAIAFGGIWQEWRTEGKPPVTSCAIVTCAVNEALSGIHHRMPVIVEPDDFGLWLGEDGLGAATLMRPAINELLRFYRVSQVVNSAQQNDAKLLDPLTLD